MTPTRPPLLADWTRLIWMSARAKEVWKPRINNINAAWERIERWAVVEHARDSALTFFEPSYLPEATRWATSHGLVLLPLAQVGLSDQYSATPKAVEPGGRWQYRAVLTRPELARDWVQAWMDTGDKSGRYKGTNNRRLGELLGYPTCCIDFFEREWVGLGSVDTTWASAANSGGDPHSDHITLVGPAETNILLRWLGVRLVAHLPCSCTCEGTVKMARAFAEVGRRRHFGEWIDRIYEMLEWNVEWSARNGIAEIRTPVVTISTRTNAEPVARTVQRPGSVYPEEGATGLRFPFRITTGKVTDKPAFTRPFVPTPHALNGFKTQEAMDHAHDVLLETLSTATGRTLLDLGCGTGWFLQRAYAAGWHALGIEVLPERAAAASKDGRVTEGSLFDTTLWDDAYDVVMLMPGRLVESGVTDAMRTSVLAALRRRAKAVLVYVYGDWVGRGLEALVKESGLAELGTIARVVRAEGVEAALLVFSSVEEQTHEHPQEESERIGS